MAAIRQPACGNHRCCEQGATIGVGEGPASGQQARLPARHVPNLLGAVRPERETYRSVSPRRIAPTLAPTLRGRGPQPPQRAIRSSRAIITVACDW